jgi:glycolate oxidase iron-sulfur subunit
MLARVMPDPNLFGWATRLGRLGKPLAPVAEGLGLHRLAALLRLTPAHSLAPPRPAGRQVYPPQGPRRARVALLSGCINPVLAPGINAAAIRVLNRHGVEVVIAAGDGCCGSLAHHMGREAEALASARADIDAWTAEIEGEGLAAILTTVSGCGTTLKDYGFMLRTDPLYAAKAARVSSLARDVTEYLATLPLQAATRRGELVVAYHAACSLQHGQKINREPKEVLCKLGFVVEDIAESHLCCGSAGTYNILQPELARRLRDRKIGNIEQVKPDVIAAGNIGCITQLATGTTIPIAHTVELIDWATGGPPPPGLNVERVAAPPRM